MKNTCIMMYGRMNPVHLGHKNLFDRGKYLMDSIPDSEFRIYMSTTRDKDKNPIPYYIKRNMLNDYFPTVFPFLQDAQESTLFGTLEKINKEFDNLIFLCGSDRVENFENIIFKYNHSLYDFNVINIESVGCDREYCRYSSTNMRQAIRDNNYEDFCSFLPNRGDALNEKYFEYISHFIGVNNY
ncbi:Cyanophage-encoded cytidylyltransferase |uniref:Cyanophage-encoded cytidylyltransferase \|nr:Cyanophage-encoded cytidylyltransferase \